MNGKKPIREEEVIKYEKMALSAVIVWKCNLISNLISHHWHGCQGCTVHESQPAATQGKDSERQTERTLHVCTEIDCFPY